MNTRFKKITWLIIPILCMCLIAGLFLFALYQEELALPSENWSRGILVEDITEDETIDERVDITSSAAIPTENKIVSFWYDNRSIYYGVIHPEGDIKERKKLDLHINQFKKIEVNFESDDIIGVYILDGMSLKKYKFAWTSNRLTLEAEISSSALGFIVDEDDVLFHNETGFMLQDAAGRNIQISDNIPQKYAVVRDQNGIFQIVSYESTAIGKRYLNYYRYDSHNGKITSQELTSLSSNSGTMIQHVDIGAVNENLYVYFVLRDLRTYETMTNYFVFKDNEARQAVKQYLNLGGYAPNPVIDKKHNDMNQIYASVEAIKGRDTLVTNVVTYVVEQDKIVLTKDLTKADGISINPQILRMGENTFLVWENIQGNHKKIYIAGDGKDMIQTSIQPDQISLGDIIGNTIIGLISSLSFIFLPIVYVLLPVALFVLCTSLFALAWMEKEPEKVLNYSIAIHVIAKLFLVKNVILDNLDIQKVLPEFLKNPISLFMIAILLSGVMILSVKGYSKTASEKSFIKLYAIFGIWDLVLFLMLCFPYYSL